jgi:hypothetical protein
MAAIFDLRHIVITHTHINPVVFLNPTMWIYIAFGMSSPFCMYAEVVRYYKSTSGKGDHFSVTTFFDVGDYANQPYRVVGPR